jgi:iron complex outermembrane receptor protein
MNQSRMYKLIFLFIVILSGKLTLGQDSTSIQPSASNRSSSAGSLSGKILEKGKNTGLPGASVFIADLKLGVIADSGGNYSFKKLPTGSYLIEVQSIGYKTLTKNVFIKGSTTSNFELTDEFVEESPVVVTGLSKATQIKRSPVPIVAVSHDYLVTNISTNIIDAIAKVPGVSAVTTGPNVSKPFIRGLGYNRVLTLFDGVRQEGQQWGDEHGIEVDQYGIDRVEVIKGPASLTYGSDALAGVVNLIPTQPAQEGKMIGDITADYQNNNGMFGGSAMLGATLNGFEMMGRFSHKEATNYQNKIDGRVYNTAFNETDANLSLGLHRGWGYSHLNLSLFDDLQEIPDGSRDSLGQFTYQNTEADTLPRPVVPISQLTSYKMTTLHQHVQHYRAYFTNNFAIGNSHLIVNLGLQRSIRREFSHPEVPFQDVAGLFLQLNTYSYDVKYSFPEFDGWNITSGFNGMYQTNDVTKGTEFVIPSYHQFDIGPFAMAKKTFNKLDISGGVRFDSRSFHNSQLYTRTDSTTLITEPVFGADTAGADKPFSNYSHVFAGVSGSAGATYNFTDRFSVKANISRGYRAPNISEISANGVHPGTGFFQIGNPDFKPEFSLQEDIGAAYSSKYIIIDFSIFNNEISNYIYNQKLQSVNGGDSILQSVPAYKFQQGKAQLYGGELSVDIHPIKQLHFENSFSSVYALNRGIPSKLLTDSNKYLPFIPPVHGISELRYNFDNNPHSSFVNAFVKVQIAWYAAQDRAYLAYGTETPTPGYTLFNAGFGGGFKNKKGKTVVNIFVMGDNLFDVAYFDHLSRLKYFLYGPEDTNPAHGIHNMGRNISFKMDFPLDFMLKEKASPETN